MEERGEKMLANLCDGGKVKSETNGYRYQSLSGLEGMSDANSTTLPQERKSSLDLATIVRKMCPFVR
jgi:hypothetical protein